MKMILPLLALALTVPAHAQAFQPNQNTIPSLHRDFTVPNIKVPFEGWYGDDTPTMWQQRHKRVVAFQAKVADLLESNNGTLSEDQRQLVQREWRKLQYRNR